MNLRKRVLLLTCLVVAFALISTSVMACTIVGVGKDATVDGSTIVTHNDDSTSADFRLWIIPGQKWDDDAKRDIVIDSHNYGDYGNFPQEKDYGNGIVIGQMDQADETYRYFHSRYSFMNEKGVAMGESTFGIDTSTEYGKEVEKVMKTDSDGVIDCWMAQDVALERASSAREAVQIMGDLVEQYGWLGSGETINITDGDEVWIAEFYGRDIWVAVKIPDDHFFVAANRARIRDIDLDDEENVMHSPNLVEFAKEKGWWSEDSGEDFRPADIYAPNYAVYATRREWRAYDLVAPSLDLSPHAKEFPLSVKPDEKLSVHDVFKIKGDYYEGTDYDLTEGPAAGPWGDPLRYANKGEGDWERSINMHRTCYVHIAQVKDWLPDPIKGVSWFGYGAPDSTYIVPLWPAMDKLPEFYSTGSRYKDFRRDSGWWINTYVQQMAELRYTEAIEDIYNYRDPKLAALYDQTAAIQERAAELYKEDPEAAVDMIDNFAYNTSTAWHHEWKDLGDHLLGRYAMGYRNFSTTGYPEWWNDFIGYDKLER